MAGYSSSFCKQRRHRAFQESPLGATSALPFTEFVLLSFELICTPCSPKWTLLVLFLSVSWSAGLCLSVLKSTYSASRSRGGAGAHSQGQLPREGCWEYGANSSLGLPDIASLLYDHTAHCNSNFKPIEASLLLLHLLLFFGFFCFFSFFWKMNGPVTIIYFWRVSEPHLPRHCLGWHHRYVTRGLLGITVCTVWARSLKLFLAFPSCFSVLQHYISRLLFFMLVN